MTRRCPPALICVLAAAAAALAGCSSAGAGAESRREPVIVTVLAAASLTEVFTTLGERYERDHPGVTVRFSFAASSELATQITSGAPADLFASASRSTMDQVADAGAAAGTPLVFARNRLEIAVPPGNPAGVRDLADLAREELTIALCAAEVPCGAAALAAFEAAGLEPRPDTLEADAKATLSKVTLGEVDAAMVYRTDVLAAGADVEGIPFPEAGTTVSDYPIVVLETASDLSAAQGFVDLVRSAAGRQVLSEAGFEEP